jgi:methionyl-tRNA synthetase
LDGYDQKVLYVWFDACIGYVSFTANYTEHWEQWWRNPENVELYQFMGKDNVPFHTVVFPCSQLGTGDKWTMLNTLSTTEYLNYERGKFSKSRGVGVFGTSAKETGIAPDVWRYFLLLRRPETSDTEFEWDGFIAANNNELVNNFGNFVNRILKYVNSANYDSTIPAAPELDPSSETAKSIEAHIKEVNEKLKQYREEMDVVHLKSGLVCAREISSLGNKLLQDNRLDNALFQNERSRCDAVVNLAVNHVHLLASVIAPYLPATSRNILSQLQAELLIIPDEWLAQSIPAGHKIGKAAHLFKTIKPEKEAEWKEMFGGSELKKAKEEEAKKKAAKKAEKERKKAKKAADRADGKKEEGGTEGKSVEAVEKDGAEKLTTTGDAVEEVTEGLKQAALQTS